MKRFWIVMLAAALAGGCAVGPNYKRPSVEVPDSFRGQAAPEAASLADQAWWEILPDESLKGLIAEALRNGYDVRLAAARVQQARANAGIAKAEFFPQVQAEANWARGRVSPSIGGAGDTLDLTQVRLGLSWEIDLWGRIRRLNEAALARYLATEEGRRGVMLSLVADVATSYFELLELDSELEIAERTATAFQETLDLFSRRYDAGIASALETASAAAPLATTEAAIPDLKRRIVAQENRIELLLGHPPREVPRGAALAYQILLPEVPAGLPSDLLKRRPDLLEAEQELIAANADVGVAVADFFPTFSLTGAFGGVAPQVSELFKDGKTWSVGAGLLTPVFQGRRLENQHRAALARWDLAKVGYERSVTNALSEVSSALVAYHTLADVERNQARAVADYREALRLANSRYVSGLADYLEVLLAQRQLFPAENTLAQIRFSRLGALVELYRALGGGWSLPVSEWARLR